MELVVISPEGIVLNETADRVTLPGAMGAFSILKNHAPLVSTLEKGEIIYVLNKKIKSFAINGGITFIEKNVVHVLVEH